MLSFLINTIKPKFLLFLLGGLSLLAVIFCFYSYAYTVGFDACNKKFIAYKQTQLETVQKLENDYREQEKKYQSETQDLVQQISKSKENYHMQLLAVERSYANKLQQSESRANLYSQMSRDSDSTREYLAHYTAKLDRTIVEGRQLVTELKAIIELRDEQLKQCGEQLKLMEKAYGRANQTNK